MLCCCVVVFVFRENLSFHEVTLKQAKWSGHDGRSTFRYQILTIGSHCSPPSFAGQGCRLLHSSSSHMQHGMSSQHGGYFLTWHSLPKQFICFPPLLGCHYNLLDLLSIGWVFRVSYSREEGVVVASLVPG